MGNASTQSDDDEGRALPTNRAFVLQFRQQADVNRGCVEGRIEHITSGRAMLFHSLEELVSFIGDSLGEYSDSMPNDSLDEQGE